MPSSRFGAGGKFVPVSPLRGEPGALILVGSRTGFGRGLRSVPTGAGPRVEGRSGAEAGRVRGGSLSASMPMGSALSEAVIPLLR